MSAGCEGVPLSEARRGWKHYGHIEALRAFSPVLPGISVCTDEVASTASGAEAVQVYRVEKT